MGTQRLGGHSVQAEWRSTKKSSEAFPPCEFKKVRVKRKTYGEFRKYDDGTVVYWAFRKANEAVYRENAWAIDMTTFSIIRMLGRPMIGIEVDNGDRWTISFEDFDKNKQRWDYSMKTGTLFGSKGKFGAVQWLVGFEHWDLEKGTVEELEQAIRIRKWK